MRVLLASVLVLTIVSFKTDEDLTIIPGIGVPGLVELGWDKKTLVNHAGKGKDRVYRNRECVRFTLYYTELKGRDIRAYFDRIEDTRASQHKVIDCIRFGPASRGQLTSGIQIGRSTRADVYALYGVVRDNPTADYTSLGLSIGFASKPYMPYSPNDIVDEISVFPPGSIW